eukprot:CAMPEP_0194249084 /NCGR_PEP_ID=MMETSP0158-20130606/19722_1 /TAXON_ID=33649 /ORGANISM="Thalassionema nitzschioides, Strain L26-B" /LENGTH=601 /DNA_ID=CAMNT_0038985529 /DNA_START=1 /DNA_END=1806 /DNA_ORIENTATION=+
MKEMRDATSSTSGLNERSETNSSCGDKDAKIKAEIEKLSLECVVRLCGSSKSACGYCGGKRASLVQQSCDASSKSYGLLINHMNTADYLALIHRGWRRSGHHLYRPDNWNSCCPALTIRLKAEEFIPTKSQRKLARKMERALAGPDKCLSHDMDEKVANRKKSMPKLHRNKRRQQPLDHPVLHQLAEQTQIELQTMIDSKDLASLFPVKFKFTQRNAHSKTSTAVSTICAAIAGRSKGQYDRGELCQNIVESLQKRKQLLCIPVSSIRAHVESGQIVCTVPIDISEIVERDASMNEGRKDVLRDWLCKHHGRAPLHSALKTPYDLTITTMAAHESSLQPEVHQLYFHYQQEVHNDLNPLAEREEVDWSDASQEYIEEARSMLRATYPSTSLPSMTSSFTAFYRFLVETPFEKNALYHQQYRINNVLVAVGVIDVVPDGLSSVYAFYHAKFSKSICPLGKWMILQEIDYCRKKNLGLYYLGYYIHSCSKMRYKIDYQPSQLLCPSTFKWVDATEAQAKLKEESPERHCCVLYTADPYFSLEEQEELRREEAIKHISLDVGLDSVVTIDMLHENGQDIVRPLLEEFVKHAGPDISCRCILKLV